MVLAIIFGFLGGLMGVNSLPHFIKGVTHEIYPMHFGDTPVRNAVAGWIGLVIAGVFLYFADIAANSVIALIAIAVGALLAALFHASGRAYNSASQKSNTQ